MTNADYDMDESISDTPSFAKPSFKEVPTPELASASSDDEDDSISYFTRLAEET